jgi:predicted nucleic acid-binding protein
MAGEAHYSLGNAREVFADTSYFFALLNVRDPHHNRALRISEELATRGLEVYATWEIVVETVTLLRYRTTFELPRIFLTRGLPEITVLYPYESERELAIKVFLQRGREQELSLCDALSYVVVSTRLNWVPCLSFDADFSALGLTILR